MPPIPIEATLQRYTEAEERIAANLIDLDNDPTYQLMMASSLTGVTQKRLGSAFAQAPLLWKWLRSLNGVLAQVRELLADEGWGQAKRMSRAAELMREPSVLVPVELPAVTSSSDLLGGGPQATERAVTIEALIAHMRQTYEPISDGLAEVEDRWRDLLPRLDAATATLNRCKADFDAIGIMDTSIGQLVSLVEATRHELSTDPLGTSVQIGDDIERQVAAQANRAADLRRGHDALDDDMVAAEGLLNSLRLTRAKAAAAFSEASAKITAPGVLARVPSAEAIDGDRGLAARLDNFRADDGTANWQHRRQQLDLWQQTGERMLAQLERAEAANRAGLDKRDDLRGLLNSYQAKAASIGLASEPTFGDLTDEAHRELYTSPTDLHRAEELVARVGATLRAGT